MRTALLAILLATTAQAALTPPQSLSVMLDSPPSPTTLKLQWSNPTEAECGGPVCTTESIAWMIERCTGTCATPSSDVWTFIGVAPAVLDGATNTFIAGTGSPTANSALTPGQQYAFRIRAFPYSSTGFGTPSTTTTTGSTTTTTTTTSTTTTVTTTTTTTTTTTSSTTTTSTSTTTTGTGSTTTTLRPLAPVLSGVIPAIGHANDLVLNPAGTTAYLATTGFGLSIVDTSSPGSARATGFTRAPFSGNLITLVGSTIAVEGVTSSNGLKVVNLATTPATTVGSLAGTFKALTSDATRAYACEFISGNPGHSQFDVISVSTPASPTVLGFVSLGAASSCNGIAMAGANVLVATGNGPVMVDVSTPTVPAILGSLSLAVGGPPQSGHNLVVSGTSAFLAGSSSLYTFDISTPSAPAQVGTPVAVTLQGIGLSGVTLYGVNSTSFKVYDVTTPAAPVLKGSALLTNGDSQIAVVAKGTNAYSIGLKGLYVWNVATPSAPTLVSNVYGVTNNIGVAQDGTRAVTTAFTLGMRVEDVTTPTLPALGGALVGTFRSVRMSGTRAYVVRTIAGNPQQTYLSIVDVTTPSNPSITGSLQIANNSAIAGLALSGTTIFATAGGGIQAFNVAGSTPVLLGQIALNSSCAGISIAGTHAYVACGVSFYVVDVTTPQAMTITATVATTAATDVAAAGTVAAVIDFTNVKLFDISTPSAPTLSSTTTAYNSAAVAYVPPLVYLTGPNSTIAGAAGQVTIVNATTPASPTLVAQVGVPGLASSVTGDSTYVYAGDDTATLDVITLRP